MIICYPLLIIISVIIGHSNFKKVWHSVIFAALLTGLLVLVWYFVADGFQLYSRSVCEGMAYESTQLIFPRYFLNPLRHNDINMLVLVAMGIALVLSSVIGVIRFRLHKRTHDTFAYLLWIHDMRKQKQSEDIIRQALQQNGLDEALIAKVMRKKRVPFKTLLLMLFLIAAGLVTTFVVASSTKNQIAARSSLIKQLRESSGGELTDQAMYTALSGSKWCNNLEPQQGPFGLSISYDYRPDGTFSWSKFSDYPEGGGEGTWNLEKVGPDLARVVMSNGSMYLVKFGQTGTIKLNEQLLGSCGEGRSVGSNGLASLQAIPLPALYTELIGTTLYSGHDFNTYLFPDAILFNTDMTVTRSYRNGTCMEKLRVVQLDTKTRTHVEGDYQQIPSIEIGLEYLPNTVNCDLRNNGAIVKNGTRSGISLGKYRDGYMSGLTFFVTDSHKDTAEFIGQFHKDVLLRFTYPRPIRPNVPIPFTIELTNVANYPVALSTLSVVQEKYKPSNNAFTRDGEPVDLLKKDLTDITLQPKGTYQLQADLTFMDTDHSGIRWTLPNGSFSGIMQPYLELDLTKY